MKKELVVKNKITRADFTFNEYIDFVEQNIGKGCKNSSESTADKEWYGSKNINEAIDLARHGWDKGTQLLAKMLDDIKAKGVEKTLKPRFDVYGESVEMGLFMTGEPECMLDWEEDIKEGYKEVDIYFNTIASAMYNPEQLINYGSVALSVVDYLEGIGVRVNLYSYYSIKPGGRDSLISVKIKDASESLNIPVCAFALAHPSMMRRMFLKGVEVLDGFMDLGYGPICEYEKERFSNNENIIRFQTINNVSCKFNTKEETSNYLMKMLPELLNDLKIETEISFNNCK